MNTAMLSELFGAIKEIASLVPEFSERKRKGIEKETEKLEWLSKEFFDASVAFQPGSRSDELLGLAKAVNDQTTKMTKLYVLYAKELRG